MSNLSNILNPENSRNRSHGPPVLDTMGFISPSNIIPHHEGDLINRQAEIHTPYEHAPHPDCPDTLACLPDTNGRPQHTLPVILRCAILGSPRKRLTIREIYAAMEDKYSYYKTAGATWKQSVRHHLSLNRLFERQPRPVTDPGFGSYWTVNLAAPPGTKRPRKRGRGNKDAASATALPQSVIAGPSSLGPPLTPTTPMPPPSEPETLGQPLQRRGPGRPRKQSNGGGPSTPVSSHDGEEDEESVRDAPPESGDEYDSNDDAPNGHYDRRDSIAKRDSIGQLTPFEIHPPPRIDHFKLPRIPSLDQSSVSDTVVERMQTEIDNLRRQSAEAVSVSLRLSEQLAQAQAEVSRSRAAVRDLEDMLEDETMRRKEAERQVGEESRRRRFAEAGMSHSPDRSRPM